jgi:hypothetical protein
MSVSSFTPEARTNSLKIAGNPLATAEQLESIPGINKLINALIARHTNTSRNVLEKLTKTRSLVNSIGAYFC